MTPASSPHLPSLVIAAPVPVPVPTAHPPAARLKRFRRPDWLLAVLALVTVGLHLFLTPGVGAPAGYGLHRDEYLYLMMTRHLAWGYKEIPPLLPALGWLSQQVLGEVALAARLWPALAGGLTVWVAGRTARAFGGGRWAACTAGLGVALAPIYLVVFNLYQPNCLDVLAWACYGLVLARWLRAPHPHLLWWLGVAMGVGALGKVSTMFYVLALLPALGLAGLGGALRSVAAGRAALLASLIVLPYLAWQEVHNWPLVRHMLGLQGGQLTHVSPANFLIDQVAMTLPALALWVGGVGFAFTAAGRRWRVFGWHYLLLIGLMVLTHGKNYYAAGVYPTLLALGAVAWERWTRRRARRRRATFTVGVGAGGWAVRGLLLLLIPLLSAPLAPALLPLLPAPALADYVARLAANPALEGLVRWEDGQRHALPQDMADSFGWEEYAPLAQRAWQQLFPSERAHCLLIGANYGPAGAASWLAPRYGLPEAHSTNGSFSLWWPEPLPAISAVIYLDEEGDVEELKYWFGRATVVGQIQNPYARTHGARVWLLRDPRPGFRFWAQQRVWEARDGFND